MFHFDNVEVESVCCNNTELFHSDKVKILVFKLSLYHMQQAQEYKKHLFVKR